jgi:biopolymer transport protein ExbD
MGLKKRNKPNAEFNMSSLTDIIFLLLIFFMLTSNLVQIDPFDLPESDSQTVAATSVVVQIRRDGEMTLNNTVIRASALYQGLRQHKAENDNPKDFTVTIVAETGVPFSKVKDVMEAAGRLKAKAIIATQPVKKS